MAELVMGIFASILREALPDTDRDADHSGQLAGDRRLGEVGHLAGGRHVVSRADDEPPVGPRRTKLESVVPAPGRDHLPEPLAVRPAGIGVPGYADEDAMFAGKGRGRSG